eukprot:2726283-Amphidinium_carterae.1
MIKTPRKQAFFEPSLLLCSSGFGALGRWRWYNFSFLFGEAAMFKGSQCSPSRYHLTRSMQPHHAAISQKEESLDVHCCASQDSRKRKAVVVVVVVASTLVSET